MKALDRHRLKFLELSLICIVASTDAHGIPDVSPRGGPPGFARAVDAHTILLPDRSGNNRLDSLRNVLVKSRISLFFMIPGINETLRIKGHARIIKDASVLLPFEENGSTPRSLLKITISSVILRCAKVLMRSQLREPASVRDRSVLPAIGQMLKDQIQHPNPAETEKEMLKRYRAEL
jgi:PPOX class probable FMN-dependent enzyme